jgi:hypothetical protein
MPYAAVYVYIACVIAHGRYVWVEGSRLLNREPMVGAEDGSAGMVKAMRPCGQGEAHKRDVGRSTSLTGDQDSGIYRHLRYRWRNHYIHMLPSLSIA